MTSTVVGRRSFWSLDVDEARNYLGAGPMVGAHGMLHFRPVAELSPVIRVSPEGSEQAFPVVALQAVEAAHPALGEVLERMRARRVSERK